MHSRRTRIAVGVGAATVVAGGLLALRLWMKRRRCSSAFPIPGSRGTPDLTLVGEDRENLLVLIEKLKTQGNICIQKGDIDTALVHYQQAAQYLALLPSTDLQASALYSVLMSNCAHAMNLKSCPEEAIRIASSVLQSDTVADEKTKAKLYYRRGIAYKSQKKMNEAAADLNRALSLTTDADNRFLIENQLNNISPTSK